MGTVIEGLTLVETKPCGCIFTFGPAFNGLYLNQRAMCEEHREQLKRGDSLLRILKSWWKGQ
jgi:hypothetical protein